jgi:SAM-dependent methyltransferase
MKPAKSELAKMLSIDRFPRASVYDPDWVIENQMGPNVLWLAEWLGESVHLEPGMRILDMGCGKALSSIFFAKEFGVTVWANDLWIKPTENWTRVKDAGLEASVFPIHAEARSLPYAEEFFDAIVSLDAYHYFGTEDLYLGYIVKFLRPGGRIGIVVPGLVQDFDEVPEHLLRPQKNGAVFWAEDCWTFHTVEWWRHLWARSSLVEVECAELLSDGWRMWLEWERVLDLTGPHHFPPDHEVLEADGGRYLGFVRMTARKAE